MLSGSGPGPELAPATPAKSWRAISGGSLACESLQLESCSVRIRERATSWSARSRADQPRCSDARREPAGSGGFRVWSRTRPPRRIQFRCVASDPDWHLIVEYQTATAETAKGKAPHTSGAFGQVSVVVSGERLPSDSPTPIWRPSSAGFASDPVDNGAGALLGHRLRKRGRRPYWQAGDAPGWEPRGARKRPHPSQKTPAERRQFLRVESLSVKFRSRRQWRQAWREKANF